MGCAAKARLRHQSVKGRNQPYIGSAQQVVAMNHRRQSQRVASLRDSSLGAKKRDSEIEMLVVFSQNDLSLGCAIDLEKTNAVASGITGEPRQLTRCLQAEDSDDCIPDLREEDDPSRLMRENKSRQHIWIARRTRRELNRVCIR